MPQIPHELIRQVQISTRAAAGLPDYDPSDPNLPGLPPLSAAVAASGPSLPHRRCKNCNGMLLRGSESIVCLYCGLGPHYDAVPDPICFTSTTGYQWLLRSLRLGGSEMVDLTNKSGQDLGQSSPKALTTLSEFLNFKIPWPAETEKQETSSDKHSEESKRLLSLTGVAPDRFFLKRNDFSDMPVEQPSDHSQIETASRKDVAAVDDQDLFRNVQSSETAFSSSAHKTSEALSKWEADFQSADSENQIGGHKSSEHVAGSSADSGIKFEDPESFQSSSVAEVDLSAQFDSVFGPGANLNDGKPKEGPAASPAFDDWNSDDVWKNLRPSEPNLSGGFDANFSTKHEPQNDHTSGHSKDLSTTDDLFQDFQSQTNYTDMTKNKTTNEEHRTTDDDLFEESDGMWKNLRSSEPNFSSGFDANFSTMHEPQNDHTSGYSKDLSATDDLFQDFQLQTNYTDMAKNKTTNEEHRTMDDDSFEQSDDMWKILSSSGPNFSGGFDANFSTKHEPQNDHTLGYSKDLSTTDDLFQDFQSQTNYTNMTKNKTTNEEHRTMDDDLFGEWNDFTGSTSLQVPSQNAWAGGNDPVSTSDEKSSERDLFSFDNKFEGGDFGSFSQPNLFSTSTSSSNTPAEFNAIMSENPASNRLSDTGGPSLGSGQSANNGDAIGQSTNDDVKMLISQMHDLSFMLETDLSIPSGSDAPSSSPKD